LDASDTNKRRITNVKNFGLWMWLQDNTVAPKESEWFAYWDSNRDTIYLRQQQMYTEDWLGLKTLDDEGKLFFYAGPGDHMHLEDYMITDYLAPLLLNQTPTPSQY
jgi:palmitoyl-protein thioesterase